MSNLASPAIFEGFVVFEHPDGRTLGASIARMHKDLVADLVVFEGDTAISQWDTGGTRRWLNIPYVERKEGDAPVPQSWHY